MVTKKRKTKFKHKKKNILQWVGLCSGFVFMCFMTFANLAQQSYLFSFGFLAITVVYLFLILNSKGWWTNW